MTFVYLKQAGFDTFQALNTWMAIQINVIKCDRCTWDKQFSNCGLWCAMDQRSTCRWPALLEQPEKLQALCVCVYACIHPSIHVTGFPCTPSMSPDKSRTCADSDRLWSSKVTTRFSETTWVGWAGDNKHHLGVEVIGWEYRKGFEMCDFIV